MEFEFKVEVKELKAALDIVSIVTPRAVLPDGSGGYLFVLKDGKCFLYSRDQYHVSKAECQVTELTGEGSFIYPTQLVDGFKYLEDMTLTFTVKKDENANFVVKYVTPTGLTNERTAIDPSLLKTCDADLEDAEDPRSFPVAILREAISQSRNFLAKPTDNRAEEQWKALQLYDDSDPDSAKGKGTLFAANGTQAFYFHSDAFDKGFSVHGQHLSHVIQFLAKASGTVTLKTGKNITFMVDSGTGNVLGYTQHVKKHGKFSYYALKNDKLVLIVTGATLLNTLRYVKTQLSSKEKKIRLRWTAEEKLLQFEIKEGSSKVLYPFPCSNVAVAEEGDFSISVDLDHLILLFDGLKGNDVELRVFVTPPIEGKKSAVMFRTVDTYMLDGEGKVPISDTTKDSQPTEGTYLCRVTRFMPSKD